MSVTSHGFRLSCTMSPTPPIPPLIPSDMHQNTFFINEQIHAGITYLLIQSPAGL